MDLKLDVVDRVTWDASSNRVRDTDRWALKAGDTRRTALLAGQIEFGAECRAADG